MILALMGPLAYAASVKVTGVEFLPNKTVAIPFMAEKNAPQAELSADVHFKHGQSQIKLNYRNLKPAVLYGGDVTSYVLWAITSDGRAVNLGEVQLGSKLSGAEHFYVALKGFAMVITAEPYYLVARPSEMVMFVGGAPKKDKSRSQGYNFNGLARAPKHDVENIDSLAWDAKTDFALLQATRAYDFAGRYQAEQYASEHYRMAGSELSVARDMAAGKQSSKKIQNPALNALQLSNVAINISIRKMAAEELAALVAASQAQLEAAEERSETAEMMAAMLLNQQAQMRSTLDEVESENIELQTLLAEALSSIVSTRIDAANVVLTLPGIMFDTDQATLKPEAHLALAKLSGILMVFHRATVMIEGYTDSTGGGDYNLRLSKQRAESVESFLAQEGVADGRLESAGYGSENPLADNSTEDGRATNRRVELVIVAGEI
jgi:outer membrane protein OmpA-like peptidoglycan-associated protein